MSGGQREHGSIIPSKRMVVDFVDAIKDEDHVSRPLEEEPQQHSVVLTGCTINSNVCLNSIHDKVGDDMVVRKNIL